MIKCPFPTENYNPVLGLGSINHITTIGTDSHKLSAAPRQRTGHTHLHHNIVVVLLWQNNTTRLYSLDIKCSDGLLDYSHHQNLSLMLTW